MQNTYNPPGPEATHAGVCGWNVNLMTCTVSGVCVCVCVCFRWKISCYTIRVITYCVISAALPRNSKTHRAMAWLLWKKRSKSIAVSPLFLILISVYLFFASLAPSVPPVLFFFFKTNKQKFHLRAWRQNDLDIYRDINKINKLNPRYRWSSAYVNMVPERLRTITSSPCERCHVPSLKNKTSAYSLYGNDSEMTRKEEGNGCRSTEIVVSVWL